LVTSYGDDAGVNTEADEGHYLVPRTSADETGSDWRNGDAPFGGADRRPHAESISGRTAGRI
jgi:hypothetical protein